MNVSNNHIKVFPELGHKEKIKTIDVSLNEIETIEDVTWEGYTKLINLFLNNNQIKMQSENDLYRDIMQMSAKIPTL